MALTRKDAVATALTGLAVLVFFATHQSWDVPLVGGSHRWAAATILVLGALGCAQGRAAEAMQEQTRGIVTVLAGLGVAALVLGLVAVATGSLTALSLLVVSIVLLWAIATARHARPERLAPA
jgi:hypothetical protein